jgi:hypothetical protein
MLKVHLVNMFLNALERERERDTECVCIHTSVWGQLDK